MSLATILCLVGLLLSHVVNGSSQNEAVVDYLANQMIESGKLLRDLSFYQNGCASVLPNGGPIGNLNPVSYPCNTTQRDCLEFYKLGCKNDGIYKMDPALNGRPVRAFCDMTSNGGGWTVIQRRVDATVNFYRNWETYERGFGYLDGNMWLGLDTIHALTNPDNNDDSELYILLESFENETRYAHYSHFSIADYKNYYSLDISGYSGDAGDDLDTDRHRYQKFSTCDLDVDGHETQHCAKLYRGGWWYGACYHMNLNGLYLGGHHASYADGIDTVKWKGSYYSLKSTLMKVRRVSNAMVEE